MEFIDEQTKLYWVIMDEKYINDCLDTAISYLTNIITI